MQSGCQLHFVLRYLVLTVEILGVFVHSMRWALKGVGWV